MRSMNDDDDGDEKDEMLRGLSGEVDDFAGSKLDDPDKKGPPAGGVTVTISVSPPGGNGKAKSPEDEEQAGGIEKNAAENDFQDHDPIAHVLGMCGGGCAK